MWTICHLSALIAQQAVRYGTRTALSYKDYAQNKWIQVSWQDFAHQVRQMSLALLRLEVGVQENIGICSQNKPEILYTLFGGYGVRAITVPLYATSSPAQIQYIVNDAQIGVVVVGEQQQYDTLMNVLPLCHSVRHIIICDSQVQRLPQDQISCYIDDLLLQPARAQEEAILMQRLRDANNTDLCNILYTSGTTGESKGVIFTYSMLHAAVKGHEKIIPISEKDINLCFLPLSHIFELGWTLVGLSAGVHIAINLRPQEILKSLREVHPTCMSSVPRFWEKVYQGVLDKIEQSNPMQRKLMQNALSISEEFVINYKSKGIKAPWSLRIKYGVVERTIIKLLKTTLGLERGNLFPTAGATISPTIERFVHAAGIHMIKGYGLTESTATVSCDYPSAPFTIGSVGRLLPGVDVKISDEGEVLLKGETITQGYYKKEEATRQSFTSDGWFRTGDAGYLKDGELFLTDRIKDLFKTSNGKYIAPQILESKLIIDRYLEQVVIIANERRFVSALIVPNFQALANYAASIGKIHLKDNYTLCQDLEIRQMLQERIDTLQQSFASYEKIKAFTLLPEALSIEGGELTNTLKVKRSHVNTKYKAIIDAMYDVPSPATH